MGHFILLVSSLLTKKMCKNKKNFTFIKNRLRIIGVFANPRGKKDVSAIENKEEDMHRIQSLCCNFLSKFMGDMDPYQSREDTRDIAVNQIRTIFEKMEEVCFSDKDITPLDQRILDINTQLVDLGKKIEFWRMMEPAVKSYIEKCNILSKGTWKSTCIDGLTWIITLVGVIGSYISRGTSCQIESQPGSNAVPTSFAASSSDSSYSDPFGIMAVGGTITALTSSKILNKIEGQKKVLKYRVVEMKKVAEERSRELEFCSAIHELFRILHTYNKGLGSITSRSRSSSRIMETPARQMNEIQDTGRSFPGSPSRAGLSPILGTPLEASFEYPDETVNYIEAWGINHTRLEKLISQMDKQNILTITQINKLRNMVINTPGYDLDRVRFENQLEGESKQELRKEFPKLVSYDESSEDKIQRLKVLERVASMQYNIRVSSSKTGGNQNVEFHEVKEE